MLGVYYLEGADDKIKVGITCMVLSLRALRKLPVTFCWPPFEMRLQSRSYSCLLWEPLMQS